ERAHVGADATHQVLEILQVGHFVRLLVGELLDRVLRVHARELHGVHRLQRAPARARARHRVDAVAARTAAHGRVSSRCAISIATSAHSSPLLPWLPPARRTASSCASTASTPLATGTPWSSATRISASLQPSATCS